MINIARYTLKFELIPSLVFLCILPLLLALGFWQLQRAEEKRLFLNKQIQGLKKKSH